MSNATIEDNVADTASSRFTMERPQKVPKRQRDPQGRGPHLGGGDGSSRRSQQPVQPNLPDPVQERNR